MKNALYSSVFFIALLFSSCEKEDYSPESQISEVSEPQTSLPPDLRGKRPTEITQDHWINYYIPEGEHYSSNGALEIFASDSLDVYFSFDSTAVYSTSDISNQLDWNKLIGFSDCQSHHHQNSVRLVWRWTPGIGLEIGEYVYSERDLSFQKLTTVEIRDTNHAVITATSGFYKLKVNDVKSEVIRKCSSRFASYKLFPYFGGTEVAPHHVNVYINQVYP